MSLLMQARSCLQLGPRLVVYIGPSCISAVTVNARSGWLRRRDSRQRGRWQGLSADIPLYLILAANIAILVASIGIAGWHVVPVRLNPMLGPPQVSINFHYNFLI